MLQLPALEALVAKAVVRTPLLRSLVVPIANWFMGASTYRKYGTETLVHGYQRVCTCVRPGVMQCFIVATSETPLWGLSVRPLDGHQPLYDTDQCHTLCVCINMSAHGRTDMFFLFLYLFISLSLSGRVCQGSSTMTW
jgi:hypothetical protein